MPKQVEQKAYNSFVKGLITEASPLAFPENASLHEENMVLHTDGIRQRRLGMDFESNFVASPLSSTVEDIAFSSFAWNNVANDASKKIVVLQAGNKLWFFEDIDGNISSNIRNNGLPIALSLTGTKKVQCSNINGRLLVATGETDPVYLEYNLTDDTVTPSTIEIQIRDLFGVDDGLATEENPATLEDAHLYNLMNQGWNLTAINDYFTSEGAYPANNQIWHIAKDSTDDFDPALLNKIDIGNSPAPKGRFLINAFARGTGRQNNLATVTGTDSVAVSELRGEDILFAIIDLNHPYTFKVSVEGLDQSEWELLVGTGPGGVDQVKIYFDLDWGLFVSTIHYSYTDSLAAVLPADKESGYVSCVTSHASRIFYSGITSTVTDSDSRSPDYTGYIFYSPIVATPRDYGNCYTEADPTSETISDLVDTDGGFISIPEAYNIHRLVSVGNDILVLAANGVWQIYATETGFTATNHSVATITSFGTINPDSVVVAGDSVYYWSDAGIFVLTKDKVSGIYQSQSISEGTIQKFYMDIPREAREKVVGAFDIISKKISWLYNSTCSNTCLLKNELVLDLRLGAFYPNCIKELSEDSPFVVGYIATEASLAEDDQGDAFNKRLRRSSLKYATIVPINGSYFITYSAYINKNFRDWEAADLVGVDAEAFLITGQSAIIPGDVSRFKQVPYLMMYFTRTEEAVDGANYTTPSSCLVQSRWDWSDSNGSNRWSKEFQTYRLNRHNILSGNLDYGHDVIVTKNKLRGRGKVLSLYITSEPNKDLNLLGWNLAVTGNPII